MSKVLVSESNLTAIADAIREKNGSTDTYKPSQMAPAILTLSGLGDTVAFDQRNPIVASFLDQVTYDPSDYSTTAVMTYCRTATDYRKDQPRGAAMTLKAGTLLARDGCGELAETVQAGEMTVYNLAPGVATFAVVDGQTQPVQMGMIHPTGAVRMIRLNSVNNVRDLGGWACDGGTMRYGLIFRGAEFSGTSGVSISEADIKTCRDLLRIRYELDLRNTAEVSGAVSALGSDIGYHREQTSSYLAGVDLSNTTAVSRTAAALRIIMENVRLGVPTYFHCVSGADRTGTLAFLLEAVCGVSRSDMDKDYELTCFTNEGEDATRSRVLDGWKSLVGYLATMDGATFRDKAVSWFLLAGFTLDEINTFRTAAINGNPAAVTNQVDYSVKGITLNKSSDTVNVGGTTTVMATTTPSWATGTVTWNTSNSSVATVTGNGKTATVTGVGAGNATITATCNGHSATLSVNVNSAQLVYTVTSTGTVHGVKIDSGNHTTVTTGQANYAATDHVAASGYTHYRLSNSYTGMPHSGTSVNNVYINWYDSSKTYISCTETVGSNQYAAMTPLTGSIPSGAAYYRVRAYSGDPADQKAGWFDGMQVELGRYE